MGNRKHRLLDQIRATPKRQRDFEPSRASGHLNAAFYTWTMDDDRLQWGPNAERILGLNKKSLPAKGSAFASLIEPGLGIGPGDAIAADAVISHPRGMPYRTNYSLRLDDETIAMIEDQGRWFADHNGHPVKAHGSVTVLGKADPHLLPAQTKERSEFLSAITHKAGVRGKLRNVSILAFSVEFAQGADGGGANFRSGIYDHPHHIEILEAVAERAGAMMRHNDRLLIQPDGTIALALMSCSAGDMEQAAGQLCNCIESEPIATQDGDVSVMLRLGAACAPEHAASALQLLNHAEEALRATSLDHRRFVVFDGLERTYSGMEKSLASFVSASGILNEQHLRDNLVLARRPLFDVASRLAALYLVGPGLRGADCQVRMAEYLRFAAETAGLSTRLDGLLLDLACEELTVSRDSYSVLPISFATLADPEWTVTLASFLGTRQQVASRLVIGIPESFAATDIDLLDRRMNTMKALGVGVAVLDFGSGFLSVDSICRLPIDMVFIDGALVQNIAASTDNRFYLRSLLDIVQGRDIATAAMWVEDERTASLLGEWGINYLEGRIRPAPTTSEEQRRIA